MQQQCADVLLVPRRYPLPAGLVCGLLVLAVGFVLSFSSIEATQLGLNYSMVSMSVEPKGYAAGRYFLGFGHYFVKFPSTVQTIQFANEGDSAGPPLRSRTSDGLEVQLEVSLQYQLMISQVQYVYLKFGTEYEKIYVTIAIDLITSMATDYNATAFFNDRNTITYDIEERLKQKFETEAFCTVPFFQLRSVSLPPDFEHAIQQTEVKKQDIQTASAEKDTQEVQMKTKVLQAQQQALAIALAANATAQSINLNMNAYVAQFSLAQKLQAESFAPLYKKLQENETLLLQYMETRALRDHPDHLSVVSLG